MTDALIHTVHLSSTQHHHRTTNAQPTDGLVFKRLAVVAAARAIHKSTESAVVGLCEEIERLRAFPAPRPRGMPTLIALLHGRKVRKELLKGAIQS